LWNRASMQATLERFFASSGPLQTAALTLVHLENIKVINAVFGHPVGDEILSVIARRIRFLSGEFGGSAARMGGSDFAFFVENPAPTYLDDMENSIQLLKEPVTIAGQAIELTIRAGAAITGEGTETAEKLFSGAEQALNHARSSSMTTTRIYDSTIAASIQRRNDILVSLQDAIDDREFKLMYQPQIEVKSGTLGGAESLIRWESPRIGRVSPVEFIPIAEQNGLIISLGAWIQLQACMDAMLWPKPWRVAVNVAATQLTNKNFSRSVIRIMEKTGLPPERLKIEITESSLITESRQVREQLDHLRSEHIRIALDDFGTGFSSLSYLKDFPIDELKVDQSFIRAINGTEQSIAIVDTIIRLAKNLGLSTTAEGVETVEQASILKELGCDYIQGYLYSKPLTHEELMVFTPAL
jgi:diguanylate cyclase (GGDEF)-like protein